jgi:hypothetical protein
VGYTARLGLRMSTRRFVILAQTQARILVRTNI